ncbi:MAG: DUF1987 domain-containing protein [Cytophagales bacterium]|nr:MAG: DUF1987 domain-containing protein [Cytophagales bacterium]
MPLLENIFIKETTTTPEVSFNVNQGFLQIKGVSLPEDALSFYKPLFEYIDKNAPLLTTKQLTVSFMLVYLNTSTAGLIAQMLQLLEKIKAKGIEIHIKWHYEEDDEDMKDMGSDYKNTTKLPFSVIAVKEIL